jgi:hypothetical protein
MTVLSRGARVRRGGRRPGWVLLTTLLVLAIAASSALVFTNRVELLKLAVILALWAAVAGAFVSVLYRRQSEADQARARDMKLVYDLQLDREISARREYELTVESQLRRELASELRAQSADEVAALRDELTALRTSLEILFDTDFEHRPALESLDKETAARALSERAQNGESPPADWVSSDRVTAVADDDAVTRTDEQPIIDVPEEPILPPREPVEQPVREAVQVQYPAPPPPPPKPVYEPRHRPPPPPQQAPQPPPQPIPQPAPAQPARPGWQPVAADGQWLPAGVPGSRWTPAEAAAPEVPQAPEAPAPSSGRRRRYRDSSPEDPVSGPQPAVQPGRHHGGGEPGRRSRSRHSTEYSVTPEPPQAGQPRRRHAPPPAPPAAAEPPAAAVPAPPRLAPPPPPEPAPRHRGAEDPADVLDERESTDGAHQSGGHSVADLMARLQTEPSGGGRRRRRDG